MKLKYIVISILIIGVIVGVSLFAYRRKKNSLQIVYREIKVQRTDLEVTILSTGTVEPQNRLEIKPPVAGRIEEVLVREGELVHKGQPLAWMSSTERAALLDAASSQGPAVLKKWEQNYRPTPILAPIDGMIISRNVESGQTFTNVDSVLVMSDRLTVKTQVDETDIADIKLNQSAKITLDAYPNEVIPAHVEQIAYDAKTVNNVTTYVVDVLPEKVPDFMRSGMTANVTFLVTEKKGILTIPNDTLRVADNKYSVLSRSTGQVEPVEKSVEIGISDGKKTEVTQGLIENESILAAEIKAQSDSANTSPFSPFGPRRAAK